MSPAPRLEIRPIIFGGVCLLELHGDLDLQSAQFLREQIIWAINDSGEKRVVVDLTNVPLCDEAGLNVLMAGCKRVRDRGGEFRVVCGHKLLGLFHRVGVANLFRACATTEEAMEPSRPC